MGKFLNLDKAKINSAIRTVVIKHREGMTPFPVLCKKCIFKVNFSKSFLTKGLYLILHLLHLVVIPLKFAGIICAVLCQGVAKNDVVQSLTIDFTNRTDRDFR